MGPFGTSCPCTAPNKLGGRIITTTSTPSLFNNSQCHGHMASTFGRNYLVCFYCNQKSDIKYDGLITQWECARCEAANFLDQNGDITDPPVATNQASPSALKYSITRPDSPLSETFSQGSDSTPFCSTCLKNQHLYTASLAQYHVEIDPSHPAYKESEKQYYKFKNDLEKRYPQCCEDCHPKVLEQMRDAEKTAKNDWLRRLMDRSRTRRSAARGNGFTLDGSLDFVGKFLWYIGLLGQLLWNIFTVAAITENHSATSTPDSSLSPPISTFLSMVLTVSSSLPAGRNLAFWGLCCSALSFWWNPKFKHLNRGFVSHINGFEDWYKHQCILLVIRSLFYFVMRREDFAERLPAPTRAAHGFILVFITLLAIRSRRFIKVNMAKLWTSAPEKLPFVGPRGSPNQSGNSMEDILNEMGVAQSKNSKPAYTPSRTYRELFRPQPYQPGSIRVGDDRTAPIQSLKALDLSSIRGRTSPPLFSNTSTSASERQPSLDQQYSNLNLGASMDWSPSQPASQPKSQHRAFTENLPVDKDAEFFGRVPIQKQPTKLFGQSPVAARPSTFWYKVPPAPIPPAHQIRNPPNQPRMRVTSQEQKENFFNNVTRKSLSWQEPPETTTSANNGSQRQGIEFAQPKFFAPSTPSEEHNELVERFGDWSLADSSKPKKIVQEKNVRRHIGQGVFLFFALLFWNHTMNHPSENTKMAPLAVMVGCLCIGGRTILDNTIWAMEDKEKENVLAHSLASILGGLEFSAAGYALAEILAGRGDCANCGSLGTILVGGMMVHEMWTSSFR